MAGTALKIVKFFGEAPKISSELLPDTVAQFAFNLDLSSGDLLPYRRPEQVATLDKVGVVRTIYPLFNPSTGDPRWLHWITDVDVATAQIENDDTQRVYYTGAGSPKVTNYALATSGTEFPTQNYVLGMPLPSAVPVVTPTAFTQKSATNRARDAGNTATITTSAAHGLTTGDVVTTTLFGGTGYSLTNIQVTVRSPTTFSYFSFGATETTIADTAGRVDLAGVTQPRNYVYTYYSVWEEESVPSEPSATVFVKEGQQVVLTGLPSLWVHGAGYQTTGLKLRVYRTVAGVDETSYFRVGELSLGTPLAATYSRTGTTVTVTRTAHGYTTGNLVTVVPSTGDVLAGVYNITVTDVDAFTFTTAVTGTTSGNADIAIGLSFTDDFDVNDILDDPLESEDYDAPEPTMQGLLAIHNSMIVGFFGNTVCFCEPGKPHAWPIKYRQQVDAQIVALGAFGTTLLVLTDKTPWVLTGNNPRVQSLARTDYILPCVAKKSVVNVGFGVTWASTGGLAVYSTTIGTDYLTKNVHSWNTWSIAVTPTSLVGEYYRGRYFGSDGTKTFIFERNEQVGGHLVQSDVMFTAAYYRSVDDSFYYAAGGEVYLWNSPNRVSATLDWKSKTFTTKTYVNMGAARVIADYSTPEDEFAIALENAARTASNEAFIVGAATGTSLMGALGDGPIGDLVVAGSRLQPLLSPQFSATFQLFVNKQLIFSTTRTNDEPFRLPTGYRADTFEVRVATTARIRAIHLAETMTGLRGT
jgi:hypothetical protein